MKKNNSKQLLSLKAKGVSVKYSKTSKPAIFEINFSLNSKTINILIGPNGSGKSTLMKAILGIIPSSGKFTFFGSKGEVISKAEAHIGYVPQKLSIDTSIPITVYEFLSLTLMSCQRSRIERRSEIKIVLNEVSAMDLQFKKIGDLSGGQLQRIILARALLHQPKLLILDEPEAGIDIKGERIFYELLKKLTKEKKITALIASHELEIVHEYADQVLCINKTLVCHGSVAQTLTASTFEKLYGVNKKPYYHGHNH